MKSSLVPESGTDGLESGRKLFAGACDFIWGAADVDSLPPPGLPEVAFAGRSNVGKSSLVNGLTGRKALARTSDTPGRTQQLNFFSLGERLVLVDMPGYGYAKLSRSRVAEWTDLIRAYLRGRVPLRRVCLLVDARLGPKDKDQDMMRLMNEAAVPYQLILTKADTLSEKELAAQRTAAGVLIARHPAAHPEVLVCSARTGYGIPELRAALTTLAIEV